MIETGVTLTLLLRPPRQIERTALDPIDFAREFGFTNQIRAWEQGRTRPLDGLRAFLMIIEKNRRPFSTCLPPRR